MFKLWHPCCKTQLILTSYSCQNIGQAQTGRQSLPVVKSWQIEAASELLLRMLHGGEVVYLSNKKEDLKTWHINTELNVCDAVTGVCISRILAWLRTWVSLSGYQNKTQKCQTSCYKEVIHCNLYNNIIISLTSSPCVLVAVQTKQDLSAMIVPLRLNVAQCNSQILHSLIKVVKCVQCLNFLKENYSTVSHTRISTSQSLVLSCSGSVLTHPLIIIYTCDLFSCCYRMNLHYLKHRNTGGGYSCGYESDWLTVIQSFWLSAYFVCDS